jgi:hypothetical protein
MTEDDPSQIARWGSDDARRKYRDDRAQQLGPRLATRRVAATEIRPGSVEMARDTGFVFAEGSGFPEVPDVVSSARKVLASANLDKLKLKANKRFMMKLLDQKGLSLESPFMRLAMNPDVIAAATRYLGVVPILQFVNVYYSSESGDELSKSQLYHCDSDDVEQVKVWVLCDDVTPEHGPLTLLPPAESDLVRTKVGYHYDMLLTDAQVSEVLGGLHSQRQFVGPAGTVGFFDTSRCLHFGSRFADPEMTRLIVMLQFITPLSFILPAEYWEHARYRAFGTTPGLDALSRMVLGTD